MSEGRPTCVGWNSLTENDSADCVGGGGVVDEGEDVEGEEEEGSG